MVCVCMSVASKYNAEMVDSCREQSRLLYAIGNVVVVVVYFFRVTTVCVNRTRASRDSDCGRRSNASTARCKSSWKNSVVSVKNLSLIQIITTLVMTFLFVLT